MKKMKIYYLKIDSIVIVPFLLLLVLTAFLAVNLTKSIQENEQLRARQVESDYNTTQYRQTIRHLQDFHKLGSVTIDGFDNITIYDYTADNSGLIGGDNID